ncbi:hypothetical protein GCM10027290_30850 [Micromonospora sonneratiae]|uniref:DUF4304 domain-containing protein n=1 Tax=Micromonospora sonneratiae TaxID=1184706 RepID=A0ABW3YD70_9ACTN
MIVLDTLAARLATEMADLAARPYPHAVVIPGDRGDRLVVHLQEFPDGHGDTTLFFVNIALCPVAWAAWIDGITLAQARGLPPDAAAQLLWDRLDPPTFGPCWQLTRGDLDQVLHTLLSALRVELSHHWLPLLSRDNLRQRLRSGGQLPGAGISGKNAQIAQLLCVVEDMPATDRTQLLAFFRKRQADGDVELGVLADWLDSAFPASD